MAPRKKVKEENETLDDLEHSDSEGSETDIGWPVTRNLTALAFTYEVENTSAGPILKENLVYTKQHAESTLRV
jgi:hypothetical protein